MTKMIMKKIEQFDKMTIKSLSDIKVDTPIEIVLEKENGEHELIKANHSLSSDQISWFFCWFCIKLHQI